MPMTQAQMFYKASRQHADLLREFCEMQAGPNPLTVEEIARMKAKHPGRYDWMPANGLLAPITVSEAA